MYKAATTVILALALWGCAATETSKTESGTFANIGEAAKAGNLEQVKAFIESNRWDRSDRDEKNNLPIHYAAQGGNPDIIRLMVENGAEVNVPSGEHLSPLQIAKKAGKTEAVAVLKELGATE